MLIDESVPFSTRLECRLLINADSDWDSLSLSHPVLALLELFPSHPSHRRFDILASVLGSWPLNTFYKNLIGGGASGRPEKQVKPNFVRTEQKLRAHKSRARQLDTNSN